MALVGNGAELEADEVRAGGGCGHCAWTRPGCPKSRPLGPSLGPAASRREGWAGARKGGLCPRERGRSPRRSERRRRRGAGRRHPGAVRTGGATSGRQAGGWVRGRGTPSTELSGPPRAHRAVPRSGSGVLSWDGVSPSVEVSWGQTRKASVKSMRAGGPPEEEEPRGCLPGCEGRGLPQGWGAEGPEQPPRSGARSPRQVPRAAVRTEGRRRGTDPGAAVSAAFRSLATSSCGARARAPRGARAGPVAGADASFRHLAAAGRRARARELEVEADRRRCHFT